MLMESGPKQPESASTFPRSSSGGSRDQSPSGLWKNDSTDVSALFFPANFLEPTTPETFLELDPAGFFTHSSGATKGSCAASGFGRAPATQPAWAKLEPSHEPCTDEIPWPDLVFWLGNVSTGEVVCSCAQCSGRRQAMRSCSSGGLLRQHRYSPYQQQQMQQQQMQQQQMQQQQQRRRVSSRVPVINLPRIEGVN